MVFVDAEQNGGNNAPRSPGTPGSGVKAAGDGSAPVLCNDVGKSSDHLFTSGTKAIVWGLQSRAVQGMLDFDYVCSRRSPSVVAMVYPLV